MNYSKSISLLVVLTVFFTVCSAQIRDSVCMHQFTAKRFQSIRKIDSAGYVAYIVPSKYLEKRFLKDSLFIVFPENACAPKTLFIGEYTNKDSVHFIDYLEDKRKPSADFRICIEGICGAYIKRDQLPLVKKVIICNTNVITLHSYTLYIQTREGYSEFHITGNELPDEVKKCILQLKEEQRFVMVNVKVKGPDGIRTIDEGSFIVKD